MISGEDMIQECSLPTSEESCDDGYRDHEDSEKVKGKSEK